MREVAIVLSDDIHWTQKRERVPADGTVTISLDGTVRELDLSAAHETLLRETLRPWLDAGREPEDRKTGTPAPPAPRRKGRFRPGILAHQRGLRDWVDENKIMSRSRKGPPRLAYLTTTGKYTYPAWLEEAYEKHLAGKDGEQ